VGDHVAGETEGLLDVITPAKSMMRKGMAAPSEYMDYEQEEYKAVKRVQQIWLIPIKEGQCILSIIRDGIRLDSLRFTPEKNCFKDDVFGLDRVYCPIEVGITQIREEGSLILEGSGSCPGKIMVDVSKEGFKVIE